MKEEVGKYAYSCRIQAAINHFKSKYPQYAFVRTTINYRKCLLDSQKKNVASPKLNISARPNIIWGNLLQIIKEGVIGAWLSGSATSRKRDVPIGNGVLKVDDSNTLSDFGVTITLTDDWGTGIL